MVSEHNQLLPARRTAVTSPSLAHRAAVPVDPVAGLDPGGTGRAGALARRAGERLRRDDGWAQFARFVLVGGLSSIVYAALFVLLAGLGDQAANVSGSVVSSVVANELHRRLTFRAGDRVGWWTAQWEGGGVAVLGIVATSASLGWLDAVADVDGAAARLLLVGAVTGAIGLGRFAALRWLFGPRSRRA
jgi:putative flippase GtrA